MAEETTKQPEAAPEAKPTEAKPVEVRQMEIERERAATIRAIAPPECKALAEECVLKGLSVEESRKRMLETLAKETLPVGTGEPKAPVTRQAAPAPQKPDLKTMSADEFKCALLG